MKQLKIFNRTSSWSIAIGLGLVFLHLTLNESFGRSGSFSHNFLFWSVVLFLLWERRKQLDFTSDTISSFLGISVLSLVLYKSWHLFPQDFFLRVFPLLSLLGWGLLMSGIKGLKQYKREFFLLLFLAIPWEFVYIFDLSLLTAKFSAFILWILGFDITRQGVWIIMPAGSIEVYNGCSGLKMILQLLGLSWILLTLIPTSWQQKLKIPIAAIILGFTLNGLRVALMAILIALSNNAGFHYWHTGTGSLIFSGLAAIALGIICFFTIPRENWQI